MQNQINISPISQFIQSLKAAEHSRSSEVKMSITQARTLGYTLTEILDKMNQDYESLYRELKESQQSEVINVLVDGGGLDISE